MSKLKDLWNLLLAHTAWRVVFWWKKRIGWKDFNQVVTATGVITRVDMNIEGWLNDGDVCWNLKLDDGQNWLITEPRSGRLTSEEDGPDPQPGLHCEITPWARAQFDGLWQQLAVGKRVRVTGRWGFDGVHHTGWPEWKEILLALWQGIWTREPFWSDGWYEIHGVEGLEYID